MTTVDDVALAAIAASVVGHMGGKAQFEDALQVVQELRDQVMFDAADASVHLVRHHMFAPVGDKTVHCFYERIGRAGSIGFYITGDVYEAESDKEIDMAFVGSYPTAPAYVN